MKKDMFLDSFAGANFDDESDFFPLLSSVDEEKINKEEVPKSLAILPLRNTVLFPGVIIPITVGRDKSVKLIKEVYKGSKTIGVVSQKKSDIEDPTFSDLNTIGTVAHIMKMLRMPDGNITVIIQGRKLIELQEIVQEEPYLKATLLSYLKKNLRREMSNLSPLLIRLRILPCKLLKNLLTFLQKLN